MRRLGLLFLSALGLALPGGCTRDEPSSLGEKLDLMIKKQEEGNNLLRDIAKGGGIRAGAAGARGGAEGGDRRRPDPNEVYAANAVGPAVGSKDAKVTIVEAFEFA
jgi:hypothetical protein